MSTPIAASTCKDMTSVNTLPLEPQTIIVIFAIVILFVTSAVFGVFCFKCRRDKKRKRRRKALAEDRTGASPAHVLYIQQKPELDAQQVRNEIATDGRIFEMAGEDRCQELLGEETDATGTAFQGRLHELRGEEHAKELDTSHEP